MWGWGSFNQSRVLESSLHRQEIGSPQLSSSSSSTEDTSLQDLVLSMQPRVYWENRTLNTGEAPGGAGGETGKGGGSGGGNNNETHPFLLFASSRNLQQDLTGPFDTPPLFASAASTAAAAESRNRRAAESPAIGSNALNVWHWIAQRGAEPDGGLFNMAQFLDLDPTWPPERSPEETVDESSSCPLAKRGPEPSCASPSSASPSTAELPRSFVENMCDVVVRAADGAAFGCHRLVLAMWSEPLRRLLGGAMLESRDRVVTFRNADAEDLARFLGMLYGKKVRFDDAPSVFKVAALADQYGVVRLVDVCSTQLVGVALKSFASCCWVLAESRRHMLTRTADHCWMMVHQRLAGFVAGFSSTPLRYFCDLDRVLLRCKGATHATEEVKHSPSSTSSAAPAGDRTTGRENGEIQIQGELRRQQRQPEEQSPGHRVSGGGGGDEGMDDCVLALLELEDILQLLLMAAAGPILFHAAQAKAQMWGSEIERRSSARLSSLEAPDTERGGSGGDPSANTNRSSSSCAAASPAAYSPSSAAGRTAGLDPGTILETYMQAYDEVLCFATSPDQATAPGRGNCAPPASTDGGREDGTTPMAMATTVDGSAAEGIQDPMDVGRDGDDNGLATGRGGAAMRCGNDVDVTTSHFDDCEYGVNQVHRHRNVTNETKGVPNSSGVTDPGISDANGSDDEGHEGDNGECAYDAGGATSNSSSESSAPTDAASSRTAMPSDLSAIRSWIRGSGALDNGLHPAGSSERPGAEEKAPSSSGEASSPDLAAKGPMEGGGSNLHAPEAPPTHSAVVPKTLLRAVQLHLGKRDQTAYVRTQIYDLQRRDRGLFVEGTRQVINVHIATLVALTWLAAVGPTERPEVAARVAAHIPWALLDDGAVFMIDDSARVAWRREEAWLRRL